MYINEYVCCGAEIIDVNQLYFNLKERERESQRAIFLAQQRG